MTPTPEQMQELTKRIVDEFNTGELVLGHDDNYYIKGTTEDLESAVRLALTEVRNEAIKECEGCEKAAPDSWEYNGPFWFVQDGERISEKYSDELEMYKDLWRFMYGLPTIKPLLPKADITSNK